VEHHSVELQAEEQISHSSHWGPEGLQQQLLLGQTDHFLLLSSMLACCQRCLAPYLYQQEEC
jgi:hypothetical protein